MSAAKQIVELDQALGLTRDGDGPVRLAPRFRFNKIRFPKQKVRLPLSKTEIEFRVPRQNDVNQGAPVGIFETDDEAVANELMQLAVEKTDLCIVRANS
jgi:hypothetical protein